MSTPAANNENTPGDDNNNNTTAEINSTPDNNTPDNNITEINNTPVSTTSNSNNNIRDSGYYSPDPMSPTFSPPALYSDFAAVRPISSATSVDKLRASHYSANPSHRGLLDGADNTRSSTYYFNEEGGAAQTNTPQKASRTKGAATYAAVGVSADAFPEAVPKSGGFFNFVRKRPYVSAFISLLILAIIGVGVGVGVSQADKSSNSAKAAVVADPHSTGGGGGIGNGSGSGNQTNGKGTGLAPQLITAFPPWNWSDPNTKAHGVSLGSWLLLERWQLEDWVVQVAGPDVWDEWSLTRTLGKNAASVLKQHQDSWITETDMDKLQAAGINMVRIPIGYWAFIPTEADEPYSTTGYIDQLNKMLEWCYKRKIYVMMDLHGMPGAQSGDQSTGHNNTNPMWFEQHNQDRSDTLLAAVLDWATKSPYSSIFNGIGVVNEPRVSSNDWTSIIQSRMDATMSYYERSYATCLKYKMPMLFHHGFVPGTFTDKLNTWKSFVTGKDPNYLIFEEHPYPGWFQNPNPGPDKIQAAVCDEGQSSVGYPVPVFMGEYSAIQGTGDSNYAKEFVTLQAATWGWSAGSAFWNIKANKSKLQILALADNLMQLYSFVDMYDAGMVPVVPKGQTIVQWLKSLNNSCGKFVTQSWTNPASSGAPFSSQRRKRDNQQIIKKRWKAEISREP